MFNNRVNRNLMRATPLCYNT